jgi:hypothetical protein
MGRPWLPVGKNFSPRERTFVDSAPLGQGIVNVPMKGSPCVDSTRPAGQANGDVRNGLFRFPRMKIYPAAKKCCRAISWFVCAAITPLFGQTDDHGNTAATATLIAANSTTPGVLSAGSDVDYFRFTLNFAARVIIFTTGAIDTSGSLRNASDAEIASDDDSGTYPNFRIERDLAAGTYYIRVSGFDANVTGPYSLQIEVDDGNTAGTATPTELNTKLSAAMSSNTDIDYFRLVLAATTRVVFYTTGSLNTFGSLRSLSDVEITNNDDSSATDLNFRIERELVAGTYFVRVTAPTGGIGAYTFHVETTGTATVTTAAATSITENSATLGGNVTADGGATVTERGVVYGTTTGPLKGIGSTITVFGGSGLGSFIMSSGAVLTAGTHYYARAYAVNNTGTSYGAQVEFTTSGSPPVTTTDDHGDTFATATLVGLNSNTKGIFHSAIDADFFRVELPAPGELFVVSTGAIDTVGRLFDSSSQLLAINDNNGTDTNFRIQQDLPAGTYYIVVTGGGFIGSYALAVHTAIRAALPTVSTAAVAGITTTTATLGGAVASDGGAPVTQRGIIYGTTPNPVLNDATFVTVTSGNGVGTFTASGSGLRIDTRYYARAFAVNSAGVAYGETVEFTTTDDHGNTASAATLAALNTNISGGITSTGDVDYFRFELADSRYVAVFTAGPFDAVGSLRNANDVEITSADSGGAGLNFRIEQTLAPGIYYVRVAGGSGATGNYSLRIETSTFPVVSTGPASNIAPTSATLNGNVANDGGTAVTQRGFVFGTVANPTIANATVVNVGTGVGSFTSTVSLGDGLAFFARAFAVNSAGIAYGNEIQLSTPSGTRLSNLSIRGRAGEGEQALLVGFNLAGSGTKQLLLRGVGPTLGTFGVSAVLPDPFLQLFSPLTAIASNEDWGGSAAIIAASASVGAFPLPAASKDAVLLQSLNAGSYTVRVGGGTGAALVEVYDAGPTWTPELVNVSTRSQIGAGADTLIAGFTISGNASRTVLVRAVGPTLTTFGVNGVVADPRLDIYRSGVVAPMSANDNWSGSVELTAAFARVGAFALPANSRDAAVLLTLPAGSYTAQVAGVGGTAGVVLLEIYQLP